MKVVFAGSRSLSLDGNVATALLEKLIEYDAAVTTILLRKPTNKPLRPFEALTASLATALGMKVEPYEPGSGGREATFARDVALVAASDSVVAVFPEGDEMNGGTGHVVEKALDQNRPVNAYVVIDGSLRLFGAQDGPQWP
jgi:hypothetical protein